MKDYATVGEIIEELNRMTGQAIHFRDMAQKQGFLLKRAADLLECISPDYDIISELREAAE